LNKPIRKEWFQMTDPKSTIEEITDFIGDTIIGTIEAVEDLIFGPSESADD